MDAARRHKTPGSEAKDFIYSSVQFPQRDPKKPDDPCTCRELHCKKGNLCFGNPDPLSWAVNMPVFCPRRRQPLCLPRLFIRQTSLERESGTKIGVSQFTEVQNAQEFSHGELAPNRGHQTNECQFPLKGVSKTQDAFKERSRNLLKVTFLSGGAIHKIPSKCNPRWHSLDKIPLKYNHLGELPG